MPPVTTDEEAASMAERYVASQPIYWFRFMSGACEKYLTVYR